MAALELFTLKQAKRLKGAMIYGLCDPSGAVFYVGQTKNAARRFAAHSERRTNNQGLRNRLSLLGDDVRVAILEHNPRDLNAAEREHIASHEALVNLVTADGENWKSHATRPWHAGTGVDCPSTFAMRKLTQSGRRRMRARLAALDVAARCAFEIALLQEFPPLTQARFENWLQRCAERMIAALEAHHGVA